MFISPSLSLAAFTILPWQKVRTRKLVIVLLQLSLGMRIAKQHPGGLVSVQEAAMKGTITAVAASLLTCQGAIAAQETQPSEETDRAEGIPASPHQKEATRETNLFTQLDEDGNGALSRQEAQGVATLSENWSRYDRDADGTLDQSEFSEFAQSAEGEPEVARAGERRSAPEELPATPHQQEAVEADLVAYLDRDGDGVISREEAQAEEQLADNWSRYDANGDGQLDAQELNQYQEELRETEEAE